MLNLKITRAHIKNGRSRDNKSCPVALALISKFGENAELGYKRVGNQDFITEVAYCADTSTDNPKWIFVGKAIRSFIDRFDEGGDIHPGNYKLRER